VNKGNLTLTLDSDRGRLILSDLAPYRLLSAEGLSGGEWQLLFQKRANEDGDDYLGCRVGRRQIVLRLEVERDGDMEERRRELISFLLPGGEGRLTVERGGERRMIDYRLGGVIFTQPHRTDPLQLTLTLVCPDPRFYGEEKRVELRRTVPLLRFPFFSLAAAGTEGGYRSTVRYLYLDNEGDLPTGVRAELAVVEGNAKRPYLYCQGNRVTVDATLTAGDRFVIDTEVGERGAWVNGGAAQIDMASSFFRLERGRNLAIVSCSGGGKLDGVLIYRPRYWGA